MKNKQYWLHLATLFLIITPLCGRRQLVEPANSTVQDTPSEPPEPLDDSANHKQPEDQLKKNPPAANETTLIGQNKDSDDAFLEMLKMFKMADGQKLTQPLPTPTATSTQQPFAPETPIPAETNIEEVPVPVDDAKEYLSDQTLTPNQSPTEVIATPASPTQPQTTSNTSGIRAPESIKDPEASNPDLYPPVKEEKKDIYLNFEGAELKSFIEYIADLRELNIIPDKTIAGAKITLNYRKPISKTGAWNTLLTILETVGFSIIKVGPVYKVVPSDKKLLNPLPTFIGVAPEDLPDNDATIRYVTFLNNISAQDIQPLLGSILGQHHKLIPQANINGLIIIDKALSIRSAMRVVQELDQTGMKESVFVMRLKRANARDVKALFDSLIKKPTQNPLARLLGRQAEHTTEYFSPSTKIIAEERTNSLIMLGNMKSLEKIKSFIVDNIDTDLQEAASPLRIYELQHTNAEDVVEILKEVTSSQSVQTEAGQQAAQFGAIRGGVKYFKNMVFQADKEGNRLIVSCTDDDDWALLRQTIRDIDKAQPQVAVQMMIITVDATRLHELGGQLRNKYHNQVGRNIDVQTYPITSNTFEKSGSTTVSLLGSLIESMTAVSRGATLFTLGKIIGGSGAGEGGIWSIFKALKEETDATLLSQPFLVTTNRTMGNLKFGESAWIDTQNAISQSGAAGSAAAKEQVEALTDISILPQINMNGIIRLEVDIKIKEFVPNTNNQTTQEKNLKTNVTVGDGQVLVLGGFIKTKIDESGGETPILGRIPILGWFGKNKSRTTTKEYVFMFMCPTIIKPRSSPGVEPYTKIKLHQATDKVQETIQTKKTKDPVFNWFFNPDKEDYSHKVVDFANARYQPSNVDLKNDPYYRSVIADIKQDKLTIDDKASSPQVYVKEKLSTLTPSVPQTTLNAESVSPAPIFKSPTLSSNSSTQQIFQSEKQTTTTPEVITLPSFPAEKKEPTSSFVPPAPESLSPLHSTLTPTSEKTATMIDQRIEENRAKLKALIAQSSLGELLTRAPQESAHPTQSQQAQIVEEEKPSTPLIRRRHGIKKFLAERPKEDETASPIIMGNATQRTHLKNFLIPPQKNEKQV